MLVGSGCTWSSLCSLCLLERLRMLRDSGRHNSEVVIGVLCFEEGPSPRDLVELDSRRAESLVSLWT